MTPLPRNASVIELEARAYIEGWPDYDRYALTETMFAAIRAANVSTESDEIDKLIDAKGNVELRKVIEFAKEVKQKYEKELESLSVLIGGSAESFHPKLNTFGLPKELK